ncbi:hypothetical protein ACJRO7_029032 [Eucalyptus globulus]|uniref:Uncharacterized protein n=1 Tax=Eucalyptus globulus TaxID=34317 RepID=A0ABD3K193_EUCGL
MEPHLTSPHLAVVERRRIVVFGFGTVLVFEHVKRMSKRLGVRGCLSRACVTFEPKKSLPNRLMGAPTRAPSAGSSRPSVEWTLEGGAPWSGDSAVAIGVFAVGREGLERVPSPNTEYLMALVLEYPLRRRFWEGRAFGVLPSRHV